MLSIFSGVISAKFIKWNIYYCKFRSCSRIRDYPILEVAVVAVVTCIVQSMLPCAWGGSVGTLSNFVRGDGGVGRAGDTDGCWTLNPSAIWLLIAVGVTKLLLMVITHGVTLPGGLMVPSLIVGECIVCLFVCLVGWLLNICRARQVPPMNLCKQCI
jgi:chloride channel 3/4/5